MADRYIYEAWDPPSNRITILVLCDEHAERGAVIATRFGPTAARCQRCEPDNEIEQLRARIRELEAIAAGAVVNAAERAVDLMQLQRGAFNEGAGVDL